MERTKLSVVHGMHYQAVIHVDAETCIEVISEEGEFVVNRFRNGEGWTELHREPTVGEVKA